MNVKYSWKATGLCLGSAAVIAASSFKILACNLYADKQTDPPANACTFNDYKPDEALCSYLMTTVKAYCRSTTAETDCVQAWDTNQNKPLVCGAYVSEEVGYCANNICNYSILSCPDCHYEGDLEVKVTVSGCGD
jgi:hypothetical protein